MSKRKIAAGVVCSVSVIIGIVMNNGQVRTNKAGLELIGNAESCRRDPYMCPVGILTDGIGNTHGVVDGTRKTDEQIAADWQKNILAAESCVDKYAGGKKLPSNPFSAAVSIAFNAGCPKVMTSTMFQLFRAGNIQAACEQFPRWVYGGGKVLPGLVGRRDKERALCLSSQAGK
ncbi:lysozyme [Pectobacterium sp. A535-S3-A17]|uniref:Lysozyme n=1 Tax=Pectobacterium quasiaquaticum TaxID=2774015 RepID=A0A9Q2IBG7_9GAMM|nr:lysozyme [Pectobacterium quasiaquaticum]MBE5213260.1 lysozyme [Pectobacterium quasiaquaticum]MBE5221619.1 lysozyme [Pectobacterium quasiaquaticum]MBE5224090.1 lysozyme [Pectobacterium quasiaquaticum]URG50608.1 lysozyme [Pectobacterium quasiaquaticum]